MFGYLDFRFPDDGWRQRHPKFDAWYGWRQRHPKFDAWYGEVAELPAMQATKPATG